ncbi:MAG: tRNA pseudouridine(13) synthase TruD, partial [Gammaproteobacteria bacterium]
AIATQWFSVRLASRPTPEWQNRPPHGCEVVCSVRHTSKLRRGMLRGNRFAIVVRAAQGDWKTLAARLARLRDGGVPNYFGEQRFGRQGDNVEHALAMFAGRAKVRKRHLRGLYLSAARAWLFNQVLAERVSSDNWDSALEGDAMNLDGSRSFFALTAIDETILARIAELDIHPTGPLWGRGELPCTGVACDRELAVARRHPELCEGLENAGLRQERRALRVRVGELDWQLDPGDGQLRLAFTLQAGSYATVVLRELVDYEDNSAS